MSQKENNSNNIDNNKINSHNSLEEDFEIVEEEEESNPKDTIKKLKESLKSARKESREYLELSQRLKADFVNQGREEEKRREEFVKFAEEKLVLRLLPVLESFSLATGNKEAWESLPKDWRLGMEHIHKELLSALSEHGLSQIEPKVGEVFDPRLYTSIGSKEVPDKKLDHTVSEVVQKGYSLRGKVLKPATVYVGEFSLK